jgi:hypothetical protein
MTSCRPSTSARAAGENGVALIIALMAMSLMMALGVALILTTMVEMKTSSNYREGTEALYAADAAVERAMAELLAVPDWTPLLNGTVTSTFIDGSPSGERTLPVGSTIDLSEATNMMRCGKVSSCSDAEMDANTEDRPWGKNNPRWQLYACGPLSSLLPGESIESRMYVIVWVADDPSETDNQPGVDGAPAVSPALDNPGRGVVTMVARAYGPEDVRRTIAVTLARTSSPAGVRILSWGEVR